MAAVTPFSDFVEKMTRGDEHTFPFEIVKGEVPEDITDWAFRFTAKLSLADADEDAIVAVTTASGDITFTDAENGKGEVRIPKAGPLALANGRVWRLWADLQAQPPGVDPYTEAKGVLVVEPGVTEGQD